MMEGQENKQVKDKLYENSQKAIMIFGNKEDKKILKREEHEDKER